MVATELKSFLYKYVLIVSLIKTTISRPYFFPYKYFLRNLYFFFISNHCPKEATRTMFVRIDITVGLNFFLASSQRTYRD